MSGALRGLVALGMLAVATAVTPTAAQITKNAPAPPPWPQQAPSTPDAFDQSTIDTAYGAFQRGHYLTALNEATKRAQQNDSAAMTLLGEIYAQGLGVGRDDAKAAQWYKLAADKGNRDALFALAMFNFQGRAGTRDLAEAARLLEAAARLGHPSAAYDLGLLYLQGQQVTQDFKRAAELFAVAAEAGNPEAQYALATMYK
jgi:TPR repeat protein